MEKIHSMTLDDSGPRKVGRFLLQHASLTGLVVLIIVSTAMSPHFLTQDNIFNVMRQWTMVGLIAVGLTFVIISGGIDLSGGSILALSAVAGSLLVASGRGGMGDPAGPVDRLRVRVHQRRHHHLGKGAALRRHPRLLTSARGLALILTSGRTNPVELPDWFVFWFGRGYVGPVPAPVVLTAIVFIVAGVVLNWTRYGRSVNLIGDDLVAAYRSGIAVDQVQRSVYTLHGVLAALAGLLFLGRLSVGEPAAGQLYELSGHRGRRHRRHAVYGRHRERRLHRHRPVRHRADVQHPQPFVRLPIRAGRGPRNHHRRGRHVQHPAAPNRALAIVPPFDGGRPAE